MEAATKSSQIERREFIRRGLIVGWTTPVIMSLLAEDALAQTPACGTRAGGGPCTNNPVCPASKLYCCKTQGTNCGCFATCTAGNNCSITGLVLECG